MLNLLITSRKSNNQSTAGLGTQRLEVKNQDLDTLAFISSNNTHSFLDLEVSGVKQ